MLVMRAGGHLWRFRYRIGGVEKLLTLGTYPDVSLKPAREKRDDVRRAVADGIDLCAKRRAEHDAETNTFAAVADEWLLTKKASLTESTWERDRQQVHKWVIPYLAAITDSAKVGALLGSTLLNEQGVHPDLIELQLAHAERNIVRAAYNRAQRLAERRRHDAVLGRLHRQIEDRSCPRSRWASR
jgi:hypothetical protein